ncbi:hypothetical protein PCASD_23729 [Puccinia coronata f. sp. avenae]|uniref:Uncharacterized protein n=1 Tax=Puccinia coronata f. sp. avenae TaxID=200324 RepID=A0A2N5SB09_9BASI|nr:hypothetical protein PCASD_23729 [Puccinia coronata f. sp. avenae]
MAILITSQSQSSTSSNPAGASNVVVVGQSSSSNSHHSLLLLNKQLASPQLSPQLAQPLPSAASSSPPLNKPFLFGSTFSTSNQSTTAAAAAVVAAAAATPHSADPEQPLLQLLNRTGSSSHTGRHRRKSSVSISPPFSRTPSPIDPNVNKIELLQHHHHHHHTTTTAPLRHSPSILAELPSQIEQEILSRPRSIPSSSLYSNHFKLEQHTPAAAAPAASPASNILQSCSASSASSTSSLSSASSASSSLSSASSSSSSSATNTPNRHPHHPPSLLSNHQQDTHLNSSDQPQTLSRRSSADSLSLSRLQLLNLTRQRSLSPSISSSSSSSSSFSSSSSSSSSYSSLRISPDQEDSNITITDERNLLDDPLGLELELAQQPPLVQIPAIIIPGSSSNHRNRMRSRSITSNPSPWPIDLSSSSSISTTELLQDEATASPNPLTILLNSAKKPTPPPLDLTRSTPTAGPSTTSSISTVDTARPGTPLSADFSATDDSHSSEPTQPSETDPPISPHSPIENDPKPSSPLIKPEEDLAIEDEERKAAEWMDTCSNPNLLDESKALEEHAHRAFSPLHLMGNGDQEEDEDDQKLSTMEKIFLFANSENAYHRIIVSQRLPELLEDVDISEAVEYVLPLLSGLALDDEGVREALSPSLCNIMWYYFSKCPLMETEDPVNDAQQSPDANSSPRVDDLARSPEWPSHEGRRKRPQISIRSFMIPLITLLTDTNRSIGLLSRYGLVAFFCRLMDCPLPEWSEDIKLFAGEPYLPIEYHGISREEHYEEYKFSDSTRRQIAIDLVALVIHDLCQPSKPEPTLLRRDRSEASESDEWDTVPLGGDETEQPSRQGYDAIDSSNPSSNLLGHDPPSNSAGTLNLPSVDHFFSRHVSSQYSCDSLIPNDSIECHHRQQVGLVLIESIAQARCFEASFLHRTLLRQVLDTAQDENCRPLRQQAASTLTTLMISLPSSLSTATSACGSHSFVEIDPDTEKLLINSYRSFASDMDPEVRKQICLGLPALLKLVRHRPRAELSLDLIQHFSRDNTREVRIVGYQILGELIHVFHLEKSPVPNQIVQYFLSGFEPQQRSMSEAIGERMSDQMRSFGCSMNFDDPPSLMLGPFDQLNDRSQDQVPHTSSSFGTSGNSLEDTERAMCCSYNFPAVLLALGVERWQDLRDLFLKLAMDVSYPPRVRRSLARSMHELIKLIRIPVKQTCSTMAHDSITKLTSSATEDWLKVLKFFLFEDPDISNTESVLETLEIGLSDIDVEGELSLIIGKLTEYFAPPNSESPRTIGWTIRERVILFLPKLFDNLSDHFVEKESEGCMKTILFAGLNDPAAAVREAALRFVPILYLSRRNSDSRDFQLRLLSSLKTLSHDLNYRVRMIYPRAIFNLVKLLMPIDILESIVLEDKSLTHICQDRVGGVRIGLSRLIHELCTSNDYYGCESGRRVPRLLRRIIEQLSTDPESVVCSFIEDLAKVRNPDDESLQEVETNSTASPQKITPTDRSVAPLPRSWDASSSMDGSGSVRMECLDEDEEDDLASSGIQVDESRLSEDEGVKISLGEEVDFHSDDDSTTPPGGQHVVPPETSMDILADESFESPNLSISSVSMDGEELKIIERHQRNGSPPVLRSSSRRSGAIRRSFSEPAGRFLGFSCSSSSSSSPPLPPTDSVWPLKARSSASRPSSPSSSSSPSRSKTSTNTTTAAEKNSPTTAAQQLRSSRGKKASPNGYRQNGFTEPSCRDLTEDDEHDVTPLAMDGRRSSHNNHHNYGALGFYHPHHPHPHPSQDDHQGDPEEPIVRRSHHHHSHPHHHSSSSGGSRRSVSHHDSFACRHRQPFTAHSPVHPFSHAHHARHSEPGPPPPLDPTPSPSSPPASSSPSTSSGDQIWMRETDGGFVEVGEY